MSPGICCAYRTLVMMALIGVSLEGRSSEPGISSDKGSSAQPASGSLGEIRGSWITDGGQLFKFESLGGHPCVVAMFYASCEMTCPMTLQALRDIESQLPARGRENVRFILVTLDPQNDTPKALKSYRRQQGLANNRWILLQGSTDSVAQLAAMLGVSYGKDGFGRRSHSTEISLFDKEGRVVLRQSDLNGDFHPMITYLRSQSERRTSSHDKN